MNEVRYWIALLMLCLIPGSLAWWFSIHPFISFWRRIGTVRALALNFAIVASIAAAVATQRGWLLAVDFGNHAVPAAIGTGLLILTVMLRRKVGAELTPSTLIGLPELDPAGRPQPLLTTGPYAFVRHPRYLQLLLANFGWAFLANYLALYLASAASVAVIWILVRFEEAELSRRYGSEWTAYADRVPRFIPNTGNSR
jgi:protein-S-isoprenylcysteine O-methyltransferase Ste14